MLADLELAVAFRKLPATRVLQLLLSNLCLDLVHHVLQASEAREEVVGEAGGTRQSHQGSRPVLDDAVGGKQDGLHAAGKFLHGHGDTNLPEYLSQYGRARPCLPVYR